MRVVSSAYMQGADGPDGGTPIILIILDDEHAHQMRTAGEEVKARGADITVITDNPKLAEVSSSISRICVLAKGFRTRLVYTKHHLTCCGVVGS